MQNKHKYLGGVILASYVVAIICYFIYSIVGVSAAGATFLQYLSVSGISLLVTTFAFKWNPLITWFAGNLIFLLLLFTFKKKPVPNKLLSHLSLALLCSFATLFLFYLSYFVFLGFILFFY
ncbi:MAG: hypothetical protein M3Q81_05380 [bacterium]|nr:hypothetical protein [bacterium]